MSLVYAKLIYFKHSEVFVEKSYCIICGNLIPDNRANKDTCCKKCACKYGAIKRWKNPEEHEKLSASIKRHFANEFNRQSLSLSVKAAMNRPEVKENHRQAMVEWANKTCKSDEYREKMSKALKEVYKDSKIKNNVSNGVRKAQTREYREKLSKSLKIAYQNDELRHKISIATKEALQNKDIKDRHKLGVRLAYTKNKPEILQKQYNTKKANGTFNTSKYEDKSHKLLVSIFGENDVKHLLKPTKDSRYPYQCDFYIKSIDLFIECNYHWTHGHEPFNRFNEEHIRILKQWEDKSKASEFYKNAIDVWTKRDIEKLECAKKNHLNYKVYYSFAEFEKDYNMFKVKGE